MIRPDRIGHVVIKVRDMERSTKFYAEVLRLTVMKAEPGFKMTFLASNGRDHHEIAVKEVGLEAPLSLPHSVGLAHFAFRLRDEAHLRAAYDDLKAHGVEIITAVNHGVTKSIYFRDPDGNANLKCIATGGPTRSRSSPTRTREWTDSISRKTRRISKKRSPN